MACDLMLPIAGFGPGDRPSSSLVRSEHDLKVLLKVGHADSATNMQVIGLTHRPTGFNGRRWYFVSKNGKRAETLFLVFGRRILPDADRSRADLSLPIHRRAGSSASCGASTGCPRLSRGG